PVVFFRPGRYGGADREGEGLPAGKAALRRAPTGSSSRGGRPTARPPAREPRSRSGSRSRAERLRRQADPVAVQPAGVVRLVRIAAQRPHGPPGTAGEAVA